MIGHVITVLLYSLKNRYGAKINSAKISPRNKKSYFSPIGLFPLSAYLFYMLCFVRLHSVELGPPAVQNLVKTGSCVLMARCCCVCRGRMLLKQQQSATAGRQAAVATASAQRHIHIWNIWHMNTGVLNKIVYMLRNCPFLSE